MNRLLLVIAAILPLGSLWLAQRASDEIPQPIEIEGQPLRTRIEGTGSPTVVLEIGLGGPLEEWAAVQSNVSKFARIVAYDRIVAHYQVPTRTGREVAADLHAMLAKMNVPPPYILVGQSFAGVYNQIFAQLYPDEVQGLVLLDSPTKDFAYWMRNHYPDDDFTLARHPDWPEANGILPTFDELSEGGPLPNVPVVVVTAARRPTTPDGKDDLRAYWKAEHEKLANSLPQGRHVIAENSGHGIHIEQPGLVVDLIRQVVEQARAKSNNVGDRQIQTDRPTRENK